MDYEPVITRCRELYRQKLADGYSHDEAIDVVLSETALEPRQIARAVLVRCESARAAIAKAKREAS